MESVAGCALRFKAGMCDTGECHANALARLGALPDGYQMTHALLSPVTFVIVRPGSGAAPAVISPPVTRLVRSGRLSRTKRRRRRF